MTIESEDRRIGIDAVNAMSRASFVAAFGYVFEHSPWIAGDAWAARPFADVGALHGAMVAAMRAAERERQRALIEAHPDLAGKAAVRGELTADSRAEQASAGLDRCSPEEFARLQTLNGAYREKFGFPFIMAVRHSTRHEILSALAARLDNAPETEFARALDEIETIARLRLDALIRD